MAPELGEAREVEETAALAAQGTPAARGIGGMTKTHCTWVGGGQPKGWDTEVTTCLATRRGTLCTFLTHGMAPTRPAQSTHALVFAHRTDGGQSGGNEPRCGGGGGGGRRGGGGRGGGGVHPRGSPAQGVMLPRWTGSGAVGSVTQPG